LLSVAPPASFLYFAPAIVSNLGLTTDSRKKKYFYAIQEFEKLYKEKRKYIQELAKKPVDVMNKESDEPAFEVIFALKESQTIKNFDENPDILLKIGFIPFHTCNDQEKEKRIEEEKEREKGKRIEEEKEVEKGNEKVKVEENELNEEKEGENEKGKGKDKRIEEEKEVEREKQKQDEQKQKDKAIIFEALSIWRKRGGSARVDLPIWKRIRDLDFPEDGETDKEEEETPTQSSAAVKEILKSEEDIRVFSHSLLSVLSFMHSKGIIY
jgi:hypothetical protein